MIRPTEIRTLPELQAEIDKLTLRREILLEDLSGTFENFEWSKVTDAVGSRIQHASPIALIGTGGIALSTLVTGFKLLPKLWLLNKARKLFFR